MFITIEGADGCGKSTLCDVLSKELGLVPYATPPKEYMSRRDKIDSDASAEDHYRFYRDGVYAASDEIEEILATGANVVMDRYWLTTYTYHQLMGVAVSQDEFKSIVAPSLTVILALNHEVQIARMHERGLSIGDSRALDLQREVTAAFYRNALEFGIPFLAIDTQRFSPEACAQIIVRAVEF